MSNRLKLDEIRALVDKQPGHYPHTHWLLENGETYLPAIEAAMTKDLLFTKRVSPIPYNPFNAMNTMDNYFITVDDLITEQAVLDASKEDAQLLAEELKGGGLAATRRALRYIQGAGRNSYASRQLLESLKMEEAKNGSVISGEIPHARTTYTQGW